MSWEKIRFSDIYSENSKNGISVNKAQHNGTVKIVNMGELFANDFIGDIDMRRIKVEDTQLRRFSLTEGDLLFARRSLVAEGAGKVAMVESVTEPTVFESSIIRVRLDPRRALPRFYEYWFNSFEGHDAIARLITGTNVKGVRSSELRNITVPLPPLNVQQGIAGILFTYDKLIENNRKQIKLLEETAQRLYKEWFVDLHFPGHETTPIHNGVPEGWERTTVGKICELIRDSSRPDDRNESTMYIGLEHMPKNSICLNMYGDVSSVTGSKLNFRKNDILFGKIRPYFHKVGFAQCNGVTSTDTLVMRAKPNCFGLLLEIVSSDAYVAYATATSKTGTKMPRADWNAMSAYELLEPSARVLAQFDGFVKQITDEIMNLSDQIVAAREARDRLLPKLMSGEIEV
ncbi:restriction endonuclease subunit S [Ellagibacter isourolithinifaciens]|uniref:restriction endonuclease subunit S n=1 Tax=Ellagibacter isourolithinifaciens TaxID=2137581 RepID=UPI003A8CF24B